MTERWPEEREQLPPEHRFERTDFSLRGLLLTAAGLVLLVLLALIGAELFVPDRPDVAATARPTDPRRVDEPPEPRITQSLRVQRLELERRLDERLSTYGWIDRERGVARIPVERAIELVLQQGLPARRERDDAEVDVPPAGLAPADDPRTDPGQEDAPHDTRPETQPDD
ncbi:MAG TPA: hypothetical protein VML55_17415 [Planctomycetaceae bacterium]|nr:hypothetical protein [Planctomycetaceae bacterium]